MDALLLYPPYLSLDSGGNSYKPLLVGIRYIYD